MDFIDINHHSRIKAAANHTTMCGEDLKKHKPHLFEA